MISNCNFSIIETSLQYICVHDGDHVYEKNTVDIVYEKNIVYEWRL